MSRPQVLYVGLDPTLVDFRPLAGLDARTIQEGIDLEMKRLDAAGYEATWLAVDRGDTAEAVLGTELSARRYDCVAIGAGLRTHPELLLLFEKLVNVVHACAPAAKLCFNTRPTDTLDAVQRWLPKR